MNRKSRKVKDNFMNPDKIELNDDFLKNVTQKSDEYWYVQLGFYTVYSGFDSLPKNSKYYPGEKSPHIYDYVPPLKLGKNAWDLIEPDLRKLLCEDGKPKEWVSATLNGNTTVFINEIARAIVDQFGLSYSIGLICTAFTFRKGITNLCSVDDLP